MNMEMRLLGRMTVHREGRAVALPPSRKSRALLAYLALAPGAVSRSRLCELLWDGASDPRGELRWCLSKLRGVLGEARRIQTHDDTIRLDLAHCFVDALEVARSTDSSVEALPRGRLRALCTLFSGAFLEDLDIDRSPAFNCWLTAQRRRFRACHIALLAQLASTSPDQEASRYLDRWLELAPFDARAHEALLGRLALRGRIRDGEEHLAAAARLFESEDLDHGPLRDAWKSGLARRGTASG
jgi:DNA-binding SARP family transcriptional activator